jgi:Ca-activated chloride channel family protein
MKVALVAVTAAAAVLTLIHVSALGAGLQPVAPKPMEATGEGGAAQEPVFQAGVELVDVAATVTDGDGRFISRLTRDDFIVYEDGKPQEIVSFSSERVPVSLAMLLDVSASMTEDQLATARLAINHFVFDLLDKEDELLLMEFAGRDRILQPWTRDREMFSRALARAKQIPLDPVVAEHPDGTVSPQSIGTAIYDAVVTSLGLAANGVNRKKAVLVLSDGDDTSSRRTVKQVQDAIRASEVMVYALGVDGGGSASFGSLPASVNTRALRRLTDETGGRTEVVKGFKNLEKATAQLADEFNKQYVIGYAAPNRDGRWHTIKVEVRKRGSKVRARAGYVAS